MRGNEFLDKMELVDPAYVEEADQQPSKSRKTWLKWGGLAACLCVVAASVFALTGLDRGPSGIAPEPTASPEIEGPGPIDIPQQLTSDAYSSLTELLDYLRLHDWHNSVESNDGYRGGFSTAQAAMEGADTVSWQGTVYQLSYDTAKSVGIYQNGVLTGTVGAPADYLFISDGRLVAVGAEQYSGTELEPVYCARVNIFDLADPAKPAQLDSFTQLGGFTACWLAGSTLYLMTDDGVCACGWSRLDDVEDYKPQLFHGEEPVPWPDGDISILGAPSRVSYAAVTRIDVETLEVMSKRALYGDIGDVFYGEDWLALVTASTTETAYTLPEVYTFDGGLRFTGECDMAAAFGLEKSGKLAKGVSRPAEYPDVKAVTKAGGIWRIVGQYFEHTGETWSRELFAVTFDPNFTENRWTAKQTLQLPESQFAIDDVLWEEDRAIISAGFVRFDPFESGARLVFAEFDGMDVEILSSDILCDRVQGIDMMYSYGSPLGHIRPFIPLGNGLYLRYNEVPDGFDLYDLSDSRDPKCLYKSEGDIPEGCRLDFDSRVLYAGPDASKVAVKLITPKDGEYRHPDYSWRVFIVDTEPPVIPKMLPEEYPVTGTDPAAIAPW